MGKKVKHHYLDSEHRPLFGPFNAVIDTKVQKQNSRQALKNQLKQELDDLDYEELDEYWEDEDYEDW